RAARRHARQGNREGADPPEGSAALPLHRPPQGDRLSLHRRAYQSLRERAGAQRGADASARRAEGRAAPHPKGRAPRVHRNPVPEAGRRGPRRAARGREGARSAVREDQRRRARAPEPAPGGRQGRGKEAHRDQAPPREGTPNHAGERDAVLAARGSEEGLASTLGHPARVKRGIARRARYLQSPAMRKLLRILGYALALIVVAVGGFLAYVAATGIPKYSPGKLERRVEITPQKIERGRRIASLSSFHCPPDPTTVKLTGQHITD